MRKAVSYSALFTDDSGQSFGVLTGELRDLLAYTRAPKPGYREKLRGQLLTAARDERFYRRDVPRRLVLTMTVVLSVLVSVIGIIAWRSLGERARGA